MYPVDMSAASVNLRYSYAIVFGRKVPQDDTNQWQAARVHARAVLCVWLSRPTDLLQAGLILHFPHSGAFSLRLVHLFLIAEVSHCIWCRVSGASM